MHYRPKSWEWCLMHQTRWLTILKICLVKCLKKQLTFWSLLIDKFTPKIKGPLSVLSDNKCYGLQPLMTALLTGCFVKIGSLSARVFETWTATRREHFACLDPIVTQIFIPLISNGEKILGNVNVVVRWQVKSENKSLPVTVCISKMRVLKLPNVLCTHPCTLVLFGSLWSVTFRSPLGEVVLDSISTSCLQCSVLYYFCFYCAFQFSLCLQDILLTSIALLDFLIEVFISC